MTGVPNDIDRQETSEFLLSCLEAIGKLRKAENRMYSLTDFENHDADLRGSLHNATSAILQKLLDDYDPDVMESFIAAARRGEISLSHSARGGDCEQVQ